MQNPLHDAFAKHVKILLAGKCLSAHKHPNVLSTAPGVSLNTTGNGNPNCIIFIPKWISGAKEERKLNP